MNFISLAFNNIRRSPMRAILTGLSIMVSAATLSIVLSLDKGYSSAVKSELVEKTGVHFYVTREGCPIEAASVIAQGGLSPLYVLESITEQLQNFPQIEAVLPFQLFTVTTPDGSRTDIFMGVTQAIQDIRPDWVLEKGGWFNSEYSIILGAEMAVVEKLEVGERLYSEQFDTEFVVAGILKRNYTQDDGCFFIPLETAQQLIGREGKLSAIAVKINDISELYKISNTVRSIIPEDHYVLGSKELGEGILEFFSATRLIMFVMVFVAFTVAVFGIINTMLMAIMERRKEIAYLKCVGASSFDILKMITYETMVICLFGSAVGTVGGALLSPVFGNFLRQFLVAFTPSGAIAKAEISTLVLTFLLCVLIGVVCAVYPAFKASRIVPMEVLRNE